MIVYPLRAYVLRLVCGAALLCCAGHAAGAQAQRADTRARAVAARFAPVFYQGLSDEPRFDYITNFDFDGDWRGDNNWANAADTRYRLPAHVYYAVSETRTHYFIHYALFHPRDSKGGSTGRIISEVIGEGIKRAGQYDPTGLSAEASLAHENDMEGCLVVVERQGDDVQRARVVYVETLAHNRFHKYTPGNADDKGMIDDKTVLLLDQRPRLYVEPKGHGIEAYQDEANKQQPRRGIIRYNYGPRAGIPMPNAESVSYDLLPLYTTLWPRARQKGASQTYGTTTDYGRVGVSVALANGRVEERQIQVGKLGATFLGKVGGQNMARPPWGWGDIKERDEAAGAWFFDPAATIKRHFKLGDEFSVAYVRQQFLQIGATR